MDRRSFLQLSTLAGGLLLVNPATWAKASRPALLIPPPLPPGEDGQYTLKLMPGQMRWQAKQLTPTFGINGPFLGPVLRLKQGQATRIKVHNTLPATSTMHWHGLEIPGIADGGPQSPIAPGQTWTAAFTVSQCAASCWYHPHQHGQTGYQVAMGLAGLLLIDPDKPLPLPGQWGVDDIPVILQDKRLNNRGHIDYQLDIMTATVGWFGNMMLTNGLRYPEQHTPRGWIRLRLLNGCNARSLTVSTSDKRNMYVIASDGGFLAEPVSLQALPMLMGERFEILIDARNGKSFDLVTLPVTQMAMGLPPFDQALPVLRVIPDGPTGHAVLPDSLLALPALPPHDALPVRQLKLSMDPRLDSAGMALFQKRYGREMIHHSMDMDEHKMATMGDMKSANSSMPMANDKSGKAGSPFDWRNGNRINGVAFQMDKPMFDVKQSTWEKWIISGQGDMMLHPFHIHGTQFRILRENGQVPAIHRTGLKDIVRVEGGISEVLVRFNHLAPKEHAYMAHCHLLEHEDTGMMMSFTVSA